MTIIDMKILCTGGSGWIGSNLVMHLKKKGHEVFNYDLKEGYDIVDYLSLKECFEKRGFDCCYHLAAQPFLGPGENEPYNDVRINIFGMINMLRCLEEYNIPMVYTSSGAVYGVSETIPHREDAICMPASNYGVSKLAAEKYLKKWVLTKGVDAKIIRFSSVYGVGRKHGPVNIFINKALQGLPLTIYGSGSQTRDLIYIEDAINGLEIVMEKGVRGEIYNIGLGEEHSVSEVAKIVQSNIDVPITHVKHDMAPFDIARSWYDITKILGLGFDPKIGLEKGIELTLTDSKMAW